MEQISPAYHVSYTKLATFRRCLQQFHWKYVEHYFPPSSVGQMRGLAGHAALAEWHRKFDPEAALKAAWLKWSGEGYSDDEDWQQLQETLLRYFAWSKEHDSFKILESEFEFNFVLESENTRIAVNGFIDGVVEEDDRIWLLENKFYKQASVKNLDMDPQVSLYLLAASLYYPKIEGVIYNIVRMGNTKIAQVEPAIRSRIYHSKDGLELVNYELFNQSKAMVKYEQEGGVPYRNPTSDCSWDCPFYVACLSMQDDGRKPTSVLENICTKGV
ncbi:MAG TPA: PD-(D/E)XK nuclease family protein [Paludibacteraceae bacterium]|nr:PD-(D/E)XK nuclease family protein [Paludibacteraceae bacterium]